jgi:cytochrome c551
MSRNDVIIGVVAFTLIVFSLVVSIVIPRRDPGFPGRNIGIFVAFAATLVVLTLASVQVFGESHAGEGEEGGEESTATETTGGGDGGGGGGGGGGNAEAGQEIFVANCGTCHTLEDAGTSGTIGPNLDQVTLDHDAVVEQVTNGGGGMPPFQGTLSEQQIQDVAAFVVASEG